LTPKLYLAPMEGVVDWVLRDTLTSVGGIDQCVTEFLRVTTTVYPDHVFLKNCPELLTNSKTRAGTPIFLQLLGGDPSLMAANAAQAAKLGSLGIDLNFGCPAKTVNRHDGGASLLKTPERIYKIISEVRKAVPESIPVTAKMRLGFDDASICYENAAAAESAGAKWLTIHCRTKVDGYRPPAYWEWIPKIKEKVQIPIIANGEIWNNEDFLRCKEVTACDQFMIGRGALSDPFIFRKIKNDFSIKTTDWEMIKTLLPGFFKACELQINEGFAIARMKQWLKSLSIRHPEAKELFEKIKTLHERQNFLKILENSL